MHKLPNASHVIYLSFAVGFTSVEDIFYTGIQNLIIFLDNFSDRLLSQRVRRTRCDFSYVKWLSRPPTGAFLRFSHPRSCPLRLAATDKRTYREHPPRYNGYGQVGADWRVCPGRPPWPSTGLLIRFSPMPENRKEEFTGSNGANASIPSAARYHPVLHVRATSSPRG